MDQNNGQPQHVSRILSELEQSLHQSDKSLLKLWIDTHPCLRAVLLGSTYAQDKWSQGTLTLRRDGHEILAILKIDDYGIQAVLRDTEVEYLLEQLESRIKSKTMPWDKTFQEKRKDKSRIAASRRGS